MSSMRNAVQRRNHKERAQPVERERYGILEKHKDYSLRARDFSAKKERLRALRQKAANRNPDEFSFSMMSSRTDGHGVRIADRGNRPLSIDVVRLLKTQDLGYIRIMLQKTRKDRQKLEQEVQIIEKHGNELQGEDEDMDLDRPRLITLKHGSRSGKAKHTVFVDSREEQKGFVQGTPSKRASSSTDEVHESDGEGQEREGSQSKTLPLDQSERRRLQRARESRAKRLQALKEREEDLVIAEQELDLQRAKMNNTSTGGVTKNGLKYKIRERKR
ncbi:MAG: hypothetical protein M1820_005778 [Bogoriella megaspora]|nr:MAG: hypothetical protein M1820_005778 [Bogoriella megaspora]